MAEVHMTEAEVSENFSAVLDRIGQGADIIVERNHRPVAIILAMKGPGRPIDECIAIAKARNSTATLDAEYLDELERIIAERKPFDASVWD